MRYAHRMAHFPFSAILIGAAAGMRSMSAPAIVLEHLQKHSADVGEPLRTAVESPALATVLNSAAALEIIADKLPQMGSRLHPGPLVFRAVSGAACSAAIAHSCREKVVPASLIGAASAVAAAYLFYHLRKTAGEKLNIPDPILAAAEDAAALKLGRGAL